MQFTAGLEQIGQWKATIEQIRDACLDPRIIALNIPGTPESCWITSEEISEVVAKAAAAVRGGRLIDCGHLPNEVIKTGGKRGGLMYNTGLLGHPFVEPWVLYHTWEEDAAAYLVELLDKDLPAGGSTEITELVPMLLDGMRFLVVGDRVQLIDPTKSADLRYGGYAKTSSWRVAFAELGGVEMGSAMNNCLDPFVTALLLLHTDGVPVDRIEAPDKLQKARRKSNKEPLPSRLRIVSDTYVTLLMTRRQRRGASLGGTHGSPIPHRRIGHWRYFKNGHPRIRIPDALVNVKDETRAAFMRSHYSVKRDLT